MVLFPNCKINLGLNIISKREDGFHNLETVFLPIALNDALEVIQSNNADIPVDFSSSGLIVGGTPADNLCVKAYHLLKADFPQLPPIKMHLHKSIPMGAGLGGGSADGAFTLIILNKKFRLGLSDTELMKYALQLGSDCPFFIHNKPCFATGRGEELAEISLSLSAYKLLLVNPGIHINTGWAFSQITPCQPAKSIREIVQQPIGNWKGQLVNDFELPVVTHYPALQLLKQHLYAMGAVYAGMSGSGSTFFAIFDKNKPINTTGIPAGYLIKEVVA
jgi:4-diphosphocytidyl-2-C-methyl-D-erythritol kinase